MVISVLYVRIIFTETKVFTAYKEITTLLVMSRYFNTIKAFKFLTNCVRYIFVSDFAVKQSQT